MHELLVLARQLLDRIQVIGKQLNLVGMQAKQDTLEVEMSAPEFWNDPQHAQRVSKEVNDLRDELASWKQITADIASVIELAELSLQSPKDTGAESMTADLQQQLDQIQTRFSKLEFSLLFGGQYDDVAAVVAIHAGAGGVDAQDWAEMLLRMMLRYCERRGFTTKTLDLTRGNEAGIKSAVFEVTGRYAYGYLKSEHGVHRLVRQSPFNADALRQTSFALIEVLPDLGESSPVQIKDEDIRIDVYRAGGHGGQGVNTTDSAVRITHLATGIVVTCQNERSQHQNKASAMKILRAKLHQKKLEADQVEKLKLRGEYTSAEWGNQIRSYVLHPYKMVKDHRTDYEESDPQAVLEGQLDGFVEAYLRSQVDARVSNDI